MDKEPILEVKNLNVTILKEAILSDISFSIEEGDAAAIIGPNGAGKTVLFKCLLGLMRYEGEIRWRKGVTIGYVPQRFQIDRTTPISVREFFQLHEGNFLFSNADVEIKKYLKMVELPESTIDERLGTLSGGELQRALIGWAIYDGPNVLLFDEPTAGVDVAGEQTIYNLLHSLQDQLGITILLVSHELNIVFKYATKVLCLNRKLICAGAPHDTLTQAQLEKLYGEATYYHHLHGHENEV
ncbi:MAG: metal ABC transporter ATP-binding protein [Candidatus Sungbacteria bacterium]|uniref:Metal ABC transporter ATP-binding protein n=1 Tax=Candidatus Sungiibacteriota bacterium TaxID=2750080 RepID=A0A9D6LQH8_9BACT|nr:metal ABC transporter ATP-binding protein [Candidatus Sungbacteria bacterium]